VTSPVLTLDAGAITDVLSPVAAVDAITNALLAGFDPSNDPARSVVPTNAGQFLLMPSEVGGSAGVKVATVAPGNPRVGLPRIQATYLLFDAATLSLRAVLDGTALTTLRTPAVSVAAIRPALDRYRATAPRVVVFGAGPQAIGHVETLSAVLPHRLDDVAFVVRRAAAASPAASRLGRVLAAGSHDVITALATADIVVCATGAASPLFDSSALPRNAIVIAVGSHEPAARELDGAVFARAQVVVEDLATALREAGDVIMAIAEGALEPGSLLDMRSVVTGSVELHDEAPIVFKSTGMSWEDLIVAEAVVANGTRRP
jgi:ornithine cyclodeaminase/alanine dehydrogenase-like protein (mu-crystallin family)